jgi:hypothetical protein
MRCHEDRLIEELVVPQLGRELSAPEIAFIGRRRAGVVAGIVEVEDLAAVRQQAAARHAPGAIGGIGG